MGLLILVRHGQTNFNLDHRFCGWTDESLATVGQKTANFLAQKLKKYHFDYVYSSDLSRASQTALLILKKIGQSNLPIIQSRAIKERDYGDLTGRTHESAEQEFGAEMVESWRRGWRQTPPGGESLFDVYNRVVPFFQKEILPKLIKEQATILISTHGNSLRALIKYLDQINDKQISNLEIVYGEPYVYQITNSQVKRLDKNPRVS